ncbi:shikimate dehydrogenase [Candidatus Parcubacteria bacterium]|jgi:shikimate dehydrogenase|nr:shikimate dehydrogenase [Candidatus Parcubacteria bacterium]MBT3948911.1 shikimate dehydrogenase [Candidatus Parcubacteria bacterium]
MNAIIGIPLEHSMSPVLHNEMYRLLDIETELIKDEYKDITSLVDRIKNNPYDLTAVTMPYKESIISLLDEVDAEAREIGSVNTVVNKNIVLKGYNTDVYGIEYALRDTELKDKNILIIGAGGVARTVMYVVNKLGGNILCVNRTKEKAEKLVEKFNGKVVELENIKPEDIDVIINTTSIGMYPNIDESPVPKELLRSNQTVFDIVYNPVETKLLQHAKDIGAKTISGLDMFIAQGVKQVELWQGVTIHTEKYIDQLRVLLINKIKS